MFCYDLLCFAMFCYVLDHFLVTRRSLYLYLFGRLSGWTCLSARILSIWPNPKTAKTKQKQAKTKQKTSKTKQKQAKQAKTSKTKQKTSKNKQKHSHESLWKNKQKQATIS